MITPSFSITATERVLPKLALDFTTASLDPRVTFTRTTSASNPATYVDSSGVITASTNNAPRFDYDPVALTCKGLLIEESRTNLVVSSADFSVSPWIVSQASLGATKTTAPDGTNTGTLLVPNTNFLGHFVEYPGLSLSTNTTVSCFVKAGGYTDFQIALIGAGSSASVFNIATGSITSTTNGTATITPYANGWYRCTLNSTLTHNGFRLYTRLGNQQGNNSLGMYLWGVQCEQAAFPTSYIPTTTTSLTRNADVATMTGTNFSDWFNATEGSFIYQIIKNGSAIIDISATDGTTANTLGFESAANNDTEGFIKTANVTQANPYSAAGSLTLNAVNKIGLLYANNYVYGAKNGVALTTANPDTSATIPTVDQLQIGKLGTNNRQGFYLQKLFYYPQQLTNNELNAFTK